MFKTVDNISCLIVPDNSFMFISRKDGDIKYIYCDLQEAKEEKFWLDIVRELKSLFKKNKKCLL